MASGLEYTIVRPGSLTDDPGTGRVRVSTELGDRGAVPRDDVAAVIAAGARRPEHDRCDLRAVQRRPLGGRGRPVALTAPCVTTDRRADSRRMGDLVSAPHGAAWARSWLRSPDGSAEARHRCRREPGQPAPPPGPGPVQCEHRPDRRTERDREQGGEQQGGAAADRGDERTAEQRAERGAGNRQRGAGGEHAAERVRRAGPLEQRGADGGERAVASVPRPRTRPARARRGRSVRAAAGRRPSR